MTKRKALLLGGLLLLVLLACALWYLHKSQTNEPTGNARFVQAQRAKRKGEPMEEEPRSTLDAAADANGNAGAYPPEREIRYKGCTRADRRGVVMPCEQKEGV